MPTTFGTIVNTDILKVPLSPFHTHDLEGKSSGKINFMQWNTFLKNLAAYTTSYKETTYTGVLTGCTTSPNVTIRASIIGMQVFMNFEADLTGTSNSTTCTITGMPGNLMPVRTQTVVVPVSAPAGEIMATMQINTSGLMTLSNSLADSGVFPRSWGGTTFTKGILACSFTYRID